MIEIVIATLTSAEPADRPLVLLGGVPVPARSVLLEERPRVQRLPDDPPDLRIPEDRRWPDAQDVVLEIHAEPNALDNDATAVVTQRPARPHSSAYSEVGYQDSRHDGTPLTPGPGIAYLEAPDDDDPGTVDLTVSGPDGIAGVRLHRDEILTFAAELIALAGRPS